MNYLSLLHDLTFYAMYAAAGFAIFVIVERQIFFWVSNRDARQLLAALEQSDTGASEEFSGLLKRRTVGPGVVREYTRASAGAKSADDLAESIYISHKEKVVARLWILDTVVTCAPLLGLVGTILGIIDTFAVLATSGISDPSGVSKGIGTALYATALGISVALGGLLFYNYYRETADRLNDRLKVLLLRSALLRR
ncbi:MAG: MotA/TolQ/ExbB proton channel family protein [Pseudomonadota bacterium]